VHKALGRYATHNVLGLQEPARTVPQLHWGHRVLATQRRLVMALNSEHTPRYSELDEPPDCRVLAFDTLVPTRYAT